MILLLYSTFTLYIYVYIYTYILNNSLILNIRYANILSKRHSNQNSSQILMSRLNVRFHK